MKRVLVTFVEAGMGHIVTAQAIANAIEKQKGDDVELIVKDLFRESEPLKKYEDFLISETKKASGSALHSRAQLFSMHLLGAQNTLKIVHSTIYRKAVNRYVEQLRKIQPDVIIDTHYFTTYCSVCYRNRYNPNCKVITYNPDNNVHGWWHRKVDYHIVNNELAYAQALKTFKKEQVKQVYFISRQEIEDVTESKEFYREKYGIPQDVFAVKIADGAYGRAKLKRFVRELIKTKKPIVIVAIAGKNEAMYDKLVKWKDALPSNVTLLPFGFVENIYELFKACDLFITKAGPNAVLDSALMGTPVVINYWANSIERTTKDLFVGMLGCGVVIKNKVEGRKFVEKCIDDPSVLAKYVQNEKKLDKNKNGADEVAAFVLEKLN